MGEKDLTPAQQAVVRAMMEHEAAGFGEFAVLTTPEFIDVKNGKWTRFKKIGVDKSKHRV